MKITFKISKITDVPLDFTFRLHFLTLLEKLLEMLLGLIGVKINDVLIWITSLYFWILCLINSQTLRMVSQVESFLCPDKQGTPEEGWNIQRPKPTQICIRFFSFYKKLYSVATMKMFNNGSSFLVSLKIFERPTYVYFLTNPIYQPLCSGRIWHKVTF